MTEFTKADWLRFQTFPWEFYGNSVICGLKRHPIFLNYYAHASSVITKKTKSNMVGVILTGEKNIAAFSYRDLACEDE